VQRVGPLLFVDTAGGAAIARTAVDMMLGASLPLFERMGERRAVFVAFDLPAALCAPTISAAHLAPNVLEAVLAARLDAVAAAFAATGADAFPIFIAGAARAAINACAALAPRTPPGQGVFLGVFANGPDGGASWAIGSGGYSDTSGDVGDYAGDVIDELRRVFGLSLHPSAFSPRVLIGSSTRVAAHALRSTAEHVPDLLAAMERHNAVVVGLDLPKRSAIDRRLGIEATVAAVLDEAVVAYERAATAAFSRSAASPEPLFCVGGMSVDAAS
jgi:hypothetical protein